MKTNIFTLRLLASLGLFLLLGSSPACGADDGVRIKRDGRSPRLDLYLPALAAKPLPLIVWIHGSGWRNGGKDGNILPLRMTRRGYAVASLDYRLSGEAKFPAQIEDSKAAIRWLRAHAKDYHLDPIRFGAWGSSAGGHLVALLGTRGGVTAFDAGAHLDESSAVQAVWDYFGPTGFLRMGGQHDGADSPESFLLGGPIQQHRDKATQANPITYVSKDDPPFLIVPVNQLLSGAWLLMLAKNRAALPKPTHQ
jgi:dipeptidyl aminopeptidase/acylaminoacyl peptidase